MADTIELKSSDRFPSGTNVSVYPSQARIDGQGPVGSPVASSTVAANGALTFSGLTRDTRYVAYAVVEGQHRYVSFATFHHQSDLSVGDDGRLFDEQQVEVELVGSPGLPGPAGPAGQDAVAISDAVRGAPERFTRLVSAVATFDGSQFVMRNDALSRPTNLELVETDSSKIVFTHEDIAPTHVLDLPNVEVNENLKSVGIEGIPRLSSDFLSTAVVLRQTRTLEDSASNPADGAAWVLEKGAGSPFTLVGLDSLNSDFAVAAAAISGQVGHLRFEETSGATIQDATVNNRDGAVASTGTTYEVVGPLAHESDKAMQVATGGTNEFTVNWSSFMGPTAYSLVWLGKVPTGGTVAWRDASTTTTAGHYLAKSGANILIRMGTNAAANQYVTTVPWSLLENRWALVVLVKDGASDTVKLYIDNVLRFSTAVATIDTGINGAWHLGRTGQNASSAASEAVTMSEFVGYSAALTADDVRALWNAAYSDGLLHVTHNSMGSTLKSGIRLTKQGALTPELVPGSVTATGFDVRFRDDTGAQVIVADTEMALGISRSVYNRPIDPTNIVVDAVVEKEQSWADTIAALNPDGWLRLGEGVGITTYVDAIGTNDGTAAGTLTNGATGAVVGDADTAVTFDGAQGKIALANPGLTGQFSIGILQKITGPGSVGSTGYGTLFGAGGSGGVVRRVMVGPTDGVLYVAMGGSLFISSAGAVPLGEYAFIAITWDGTTQKIYVNGLLISATVTASLTLTQAFWLGAQAATSTNYAFKGDLDEFFWGKRAWSTNEVQQLQATWTNTTLTVDRSLQASLSFSARFETAAPPPEPEPDSPVPAPTPLPDGDAGGAVTANIPLTPYRAQLNADSFERAWVGRALPDTQGERDAIALDGLPGFPDATSTNWKNWFCSNYGINPSTGAQIANVLGGATPWYIDAARNPIHVVDADQPLRNPGVHDQDTTVAGWAAETNAAIAAMGGIPIPADARRDFTGDRYVLIYQPSTGGIWTIYAFSPRVGTTEAATTTIQLSGSPSNGGFFLNFDYLDPLSGGTYFTQSSVPYNVTAAGLKTILESAKLTSGAVLGASRSSQATLVVGGGPLNVAPITITWRHALQLRCVPMRATDNFMNSGHVLFTYKNADPWTGGNLLGITSPAIANAQHHVRQRISPNGGTATAAGIEQLATILDWWEYRAAYDAGIAAGDGTIAGADWDAPGTDMGHVLGMCVGNCGAGSIYPAVRGDGTFNNPTRSLPMQGSIWTFPLTATRPNTVTYHFLQPLFNTIQRYGIIWYDKTGLGNTLICRAWGWPGQVTPFPGPPGMTLSSANYPIWMRQMPWWQAQILDPADVLAGW